MGTQRAMEGSIGVIAGPIHGFLATGRLCVAHGQVSRPENARKIVLQCGCIVLLHMDRGSLTSGSQIKRKTGLSLKYRTGEGSG